MIMMRKRGGAVLMLLAATLFVAAPANGQREHPGRANHIGRPVHAPNHRANGSGPRFSSSDGGMTVHDDLLHVTWLADADYPAAHKFGLPVNDSGSMDYQTAQNWMTKLRESDGPLGHKKWQLPMTPPQDKDCNTRGPKPLYDKFGYGCDHSAMGSLFYDRSGFALSAYDTAVPIPRRDFHGFSNIQPYLYWTSTTGNNKSANAGGYVTFSFATGWMGNNVYQHVMYVWPVISGNPFGAPTGSGRLVSVKGGEAFYDDNTKLTWTADANLAARPEFQVSGVNKDGSMMQPKDKETEPATVAAFLSALNHHGPKGYLGQSQWELPPASLISGLPCGGFKCDTSPLGELFYTEFGLAKGGSAATPPDIAVGPFHHLQPYLYWSCQGVEGKPACDDKTPGKNFAWSFSFGNGFEGTDLIANDLFVMVYYPDESTPKPPGRPPIKCRTAQSCCAQNGGTWERGRCI